MIPPTRKGATAITSIAAAVMLATSCGGGSRGPAKGDLSLTASALPAGFRALAGPVGLQPSVQKVASSISPNACGQIGSGRLLDFASADGGVYLVVGVRDLGSPDRAKEVLRALGDAGCLKDPIHALGYDPQKSDPPPAPAAGDDQATAQRFVLDQSGTITPTRDSFHIAVIAIYLVRRGSKVYGLFEVAAGGGPVDDALAAGALTEVAGAGQAHPQSSTTTTASPTVSGASLTVDGKTLAVDGASCSSNAGAQMEGKLDGTTYMLNLTPNGARLAAGQTTLIDVSNAMRFTLTVIGPGARGGFAQGRVGSGRVSVSADAKTWTITATLSTTGAGAGDIAISAALPGCA